MDLITRNGRTVGTMLTKEIPRKFVHFILFQFLRTWETKYIYIYTHTFNPKLVTTPSCSKDKSQFEDKALFSPSAYLKTTFLYYSILKCNCNLFELGPRIDGWMACTLGFRNYSWDKTLLK